MNQKQQRKSNIAAPLATATMQPWLRMHEITCRRCCLRPAACARLSNQGSAAHPERLEGRQFLVLAPYARYFNMLTICARLSTTPQLFASWVCCRWHPASAEFSLVAHAAQHEWSLECGLQRL